jgi:glycosyltransferase EpsD
LAGDGILLEEYKALAKSLNLEEHIDFLGYRSDIPELLAISNVSVSASRREGLPVNVMEAMATGLPLVVTDIRGHRDLVINGENGYVVGTDDVEDFVDSIEKLYKDERLRKEFGEKGLALVQKYALENVIEEMQEIYVSQLGGEF